MMKGNLAVRMTAVSETYDSWLRAKVREALEDMRSTIPHSEVMDDVQAIIDKKRASD